MIYNKLFKDNYIYICMNDIEKKNIAYINMNSNILSVNNMNPPLPTSGEIEILNRIRFNQNVRKLINNRTNKITYRARSFDDIENIFNQLQNVPFNILLKMGNLAYTMNQANNFRLRQNLDELLTSNIVINSDGELVQ